MQMDRADFTLRDSGNTGDHTHEIARLDRVSAAGVEGETDHARFVGDGAGFFARAGAFGRFAAGAAGTVVVLAEAFAAVAGGGVRQAARGRIMSMIRIKSRNKTAR